MYKNLYLFLVLILGVNCCSSEEEIPTCLDDEISKYTEMLIGNTCGVTSLQIDQYSFQGQVVYQLPWTVCVFDSGSPVTDSNCEVIGSIGGWSNNQINDEDFIENAEFLRTVWKMEI